jgi:hypothetical protein
MGDVAVLANHQKLSNYLLTCLDVRMLCAGLSNTFGDSMIIVFVGANLLSLQR